jgi:hypothetical protein
MTKRDQAQGFGGSSPQQAKHGTRPATAGGFRVAQIEHTLCGRFALLVIGCTTVPTTVTRHTTNNALRQGSAQSISKHQDFDAVEVKDE